MSAPKLKAPARHVKLNPDQQSRWQHHLDDCESPIERLFLSAYIILLDQKLGSHEFVVSRTIDGAKTTAQGLVERFDRVDMVVIQPQVGSYRPDFAVSRIFNDGAECDPIWCPITIVECDGYEYHDASKERAARDKSRDRFLQADGFYVLRFTGLEIWNHACRCAKEVDEFLSESGYRTAAARYGLPT